MNLSDGLIKLKRYSLRIYVADSTHVERLVQCYAGERVVKVATIGAEYMEVVIGHRPEAKSVAGGRKKSYIIKLGDCTITKSGITKSGEALASSLVGAPRFGGTIQL